MSEKRVNLSLSYIDVINAAYGNLNSLEKSIADYILKNATACQHLSARELAEQCGCSGATIVRFARKLNYDGFTDLKHHIRRGGNPSNDPLWNESYLWRNSHALHSTKGECSVIGYAIAKGKTSGINIYDTYLMMKLLVPNHLVIYEGAKGEWATDK